MKNKKKYQKKKQVYNFEAVHPPDSADLLRERERRLKDLEQLTLLSDVFMSVVLSDLKACQHVVRILIGNPGITLVSVKHSMLFQKSPRTEPDLTFLRKMQTKRSIILKSRERM